MIIIEENGRDMMVFGIKEMDMTEFENWLNETTFSGCTGISKYIIPKDNKKVNVYIISCDVSTGRQDILEYWYNKGLEPSDENFMQSYI